MPAGPAEPRLVVPLGKPGEYLAFGEEGVAYVGQPDPRMFAWVQIRAVGKRLEVGAVAVETVQTWGVGGRDIAKLRLGLIETVINSPAHADTVRATLPPAGSWLVGRIMGEYAPVHTGISIARSVDRKLTVPTTRTKPDEFYKQVAELHSEVSGVSSQPAVEIARANGVPTSTVYRWLKEARRRGILAPTRRANKKAVATDELAEGSEE